LKPALANSSRDPILKNPITKRAGGVAQGVRPEFKPQDGKKKKKARFRKTNMRCPLSSVDSRPYMYGLLYAYPKHKCKCGTAGATSGRGETERK
jgi:hypothetical protein